jgi:ATP-dependent Zn protease
VSEKKLGANIKQSIVALLIILALSVCLLSVQQAAAQSDQASSKLQVANDAVNQAFNAVLDAEKSGANVTDLMFRLNYAIGILAQAENSYRTGYFDKSSAQAESVLPLAQKVTLDAQNAKKTATISSQNTFLLTIAFTIIGMILFLEILFLVWVWFKRRYIKNLSGAKPEVVSQ